MALSEIRQRVKSMEERERMRIAICDDELQYRQLIHEKLLQDSICCDYETEISEYESAAELLAATEKGYSADVRR